MTPRLSRYHLVNLLQSAQAGAFRKEAQRICALVKQPILALPVKIISFTFRDLRLLPS